MRNYYQILKTYGTLNLLKKFLIFIKRKLQIDRLFLRFVPYDNFRFMLKSCINKLEWNNVEFLSDVNLTKITDFSENVNDEFKIDFLDRYNKLTNNIYPFFSYKWVEIKELDFNFDPLENIHWPTGRFRSSYFQFDIKKGDIKRVFELNRLQFLDIVISAWYFSDYKTRLELKSYVSDVLTQWLDQNPHERSVAWSCSQEISIRGIKIILLLRHIGVTPSLKRKIHNLLFLSARHVMKEIGYAISQRNNHAITEACFLLLYGKLTSYCQTGKDSIKLSYKTLKAILPDQFFSDGTYIQNSITYQRFALQNLLLIYAVCPPTIKNELQRIFSSNLRFLKKCMFGKNGEFPNYGPNDGAMLYNFGWNDYRDLRPLINQLHFALHGRSYYTDKKLTIDNCFTLVNDNFVQPIKDADKLIVNDSFNIGGLYFLKNGRIDILFICTDFANRFPSHCDSLHLEIWFDNKPIFTDSGSYEYFGQKGVDYFQSFMFTSAHNTIRVNELEQLDKGPRFMWLSGIKSRIVNETYNSLTGRSCAYHGRLPGNPTIEREIILNDNKITITDSIVSQINNQMISETFWNYKNSDKPLIDGNKLFFDNVEMKYESDNFEKFELQKGFSSLYYANYAPRTRLVIKTNGAGTVKAKTTFTFK